MSDITIDSMEGGAPDEAIIAFVDAGPTADLSDWVRRYPRQSAELAHAAAERWAEGETHGGGVHMAATVLRGTDSSATAVARFKSLGREIAAARRSAAAPSAPPITSLIAAARERGLDPQALCVRARLPYAMVFKLHRRLIAPDSMPRLLIAQLAEALGRTVEEISAYFKLPPALAAGASYRSDAAPRAGAQESFAQALARDPDATAEHLSFYGTSVGGSKGE